jgi:hypothetical protein
MWNPLRRILGQPNEKPLTAREVGRIMKIDTSGDPLAYSPLTFHVTLWPAFPHFSRFAADPRVQGIRLNSAMMKASEIDDDFEREVARARAPLWFDIKGMQMRVKEVLSYRDHLEFVLNRPVKVKTPCTVWFKAGEDAGTCVEIRNGTHFVFAPGGPQYNVSAGESIHIRDAACEVGGETFMPHEVEKIERVRGLGFTRWYLSYVYKQRHVDEFRELIGPNAELILKIENEAGLRYVAEQYRPTPNTRLMAARGDLFVELARPHQIVSACRQIVVADPDAFVGSRMLLSLVRGDTPSCADLFELEALRLMGFRNFLLCDELCLKEDMLGAAVNVFDACRYSV